MTLDAVLHDTYGWADANAHLVLLVAAALPVAGTALAALFHLGRTERTARAVASALVGLGLLAVIVEVMAVLVAHTAYGASPLEGNLALLAAPFVLLAGAVVGARRVAPLSELGSVRTAADLLGFVAAACSATWLLSRFHWGVVFFGSIAQLVVIAVLAGLLLRRLARRAFGPSDQRP